jgi:dynein heavy chain
MKDKMLPTPAKFHYIFNLRELSRVFQGIMLTPTDTLKTGGYRCDRNQEPFAGGGLTLLRIWKHECSRVFSDKLTNLKDKGLFDQFLHAELNETFGQEMTEKCAKDFYMVNFLRPDVFDEEGVLLKKKSIRAKQLSGKNQAAKYQTALGKPQLLQFQI